MTGRIATTFPGAARIVRGEDEWEVYRAARPDDIDTVDAYLGSVYHEDGAWWAITAVFEDVTYSDGYTDRRYRGVGEPHPITPATTTERNRNA